MEYNDIYDINRKLTGKTHLRGKPLQPGEYGLVACVWVYDGKGNVLMTRRAKEKIFAGTWENSGGAVFAGETSLQAIARELREETGICAAETEFRLIDTGMDSQTHYDYYALCRDVSIEDIVLQPGETDDAKWVSFSQVHQMIDRGEICQVIAKQFLIQEPLLQSLLETEVKR